MPELPEVHTTVEGIKRTVIGLSISDVWTNYISNYAPYKNQIKNPDYFKSFKKKVIGAKIIGSERRHKNILIHLSNGYTVLIHMKMTGHIMYGKYVQTKKKDRVELWENEEWQPDSTETKYLWDPFNRHIRFVFTLSNGKHLILSDMRKFAKITLLETKHLETSDEIFNIGPEPLEKEFTFNIFKKQLLLKSKTPIKSVLMDHTLIAGIGNIYSDEILWESKVHPESLPGNIPNDVLEVIYKNIKPILKKAIQYGGDSTSDYRDIDGKAGDFQNRHNVYRKTGNECTKKDGGIIERKVIRGRSGHFCPVHQVKY